MTTCSQNPPLTPDELSDLLSDTTKTPPYKSAVVAQWPPIPPDISVSTGSGVTPSQAALQSKGTPVIAKDQTLVTSAAQRNLALQAGRPLLELDLDAEMPAPLSAEAQNRRDIMKNFFKDLPNDLPSWELLVAMPVPECMSFINSKIDREKEGTGDTAEVDKFMQATKPVVYSLEQTDDCMTLLHSARFLRAPLSEPVVYFPLMEKKRVPIVTNLPEGAIGFDCGISDLAIRKMSDRTQPLALKHLLKSNSMVERSAPIKKARAIQGLEIGDYCESTYVSDYDFKSAEYPWEILEAMLSAVAVSQQIWPLDFGILNVLRALTHIQLFHNPRISMKLQVLMCTTYIDNAFIQNSKKARASMPPLSVKDCVELAKSTWSRLKMKDVEWSNVLTLAASNGPLLPGQDAAAFAKFELSNLGVARKKQQQQLQQQLVRMQDPPYGGGRRPQNAAGGRRNGGGKRPHTNKPAAAGSAGRRGLEICPAFSKGIPCPRGGDSKASCATTSGVVLHHLCEICGFNTHGSKNHI